MPSTLKLIKNKKLATDVAYSTDPFGDGSLYALYKMNEVDGDANDLVDTMGGPTMDKYNAISAPSAIPGGVRGKHFGRRGYATDGVYAKQVMTISFWHSMDRDNREGMLGFGNHFEGYPTAGAYLFFHGYFNTYKLYASDGTTLFTHSQAIPADSVYRNVVIIAGGTYVKLYIDSVLQTTLNVTYKTLTAQRLYINYDHKYDTGNAQTDEQGTFDHLQIFDRVLNQREIDVLYNQTVS